MFYNISNYDHDKLNILVCPIFCLGNLVINTLFRIHQSGLPGPAGALLISPWVDLTDTGVSASWVNNARFDYLDKELASFFAECYKGEMSETSLIDLSPIYSDIMHILPPLHIEFGSCEVLHDQIQAFSDRAKSAGVEVTSIAREDMVHVFPIYSFSGMQQCEDSFQDMVNFINKTIPVVEYV